MNPKSIYLSYAEKDTPTVNNIRALLATWFGSTSPIYVRDFDLNLGANRLTSLDDALDETKWFIIVYTQNASESSWITQEISAQAMRSMKNNRYEIIVLKLDDVEYPSHLTTYLQQKTTINAITDLETAVFEVAVYISNHEASSSDDTTYTNRGGDTDNFWSQVARKNKICFIWGWSGIGKTSFVNNSIKEKFKKRPLTIKLTRGHSIDRLCREVINVCKERPQPFNVNITDNKLLSEALSALRKRSEHFFLFLDDAENGLDSGNVFQSFLELFLEKFIDADLDTRIVLATTRSPDIENDVILRNSNIYRLHELTNNDVEEAIEKWLKYSPNILQDAKINLTSWNEVIEIIDGYPLGINLVSMSLLGGRKTSDIISETGRKSVQARAAKSILKSFSTNIMNDFHKSILFTLSIINSPISMNDMRSIMSFRTISISDLQIHRSELLTWGLIESNIDPNSLNEIMYVHRFIRTHFIEEIKRSNGLYKEIAEQFGRYAQQKTILFYRQLLTLAEENSLDNPKIEWLSNEVFRYALPADRLLRSVGLNNLADSIPNEFRVTGTLRELVFYYYQEEKNYVKALEYAEKWLAIQPNDYRIKLFQARCYRNFRDHLSLDKAKKIVNDLEILNRSRKRQPGAEIHREKALIADFGGNEAEAIDHFLDGIRSDKRDSYTENYTGLAMIYIRQAERMFDGDPKREENIREALELLEFARGTESNQKREQFDLYHIGTYAEALILNGQDEVAFPLLKQALENRPGNASIAYRLGEIYRKRNDIEQAEKYARKALIGEPKAHMTLANIARYKASTTQNTNENNAYLNDALQLLEQFNPDYGSGHEVKVTVKSQILRELDNIKDAWDTIKEYSDTHSPHLIKEKCIVLKLLAQEAEITEKNPIQALEYRKEGLINIKKLKNNDVLNIQESMQEFQNEINRLEILL